MRTHGRLAVALLTFAGLGSGCSTLGPTRTPTRCEALCARYFNPGSAAVAKNARTCVCWAPFLSGEAGSRPTTATIEVVRR
jgi:hypothetical protein